MTPTFVAIAPLFAPSVSANIGRIERRRKKARDNERKSERGDRMRDREREID